jgi:anti-anti-sigma regulatory factor
MPVKTARKGKCSFIEATGSLGVEQSGELLESLRKALSGSDMKISLDLSGVTESDISALQIICSAHKSAARRGKTFYISRIAPELGQAASDSGFTLRSDCAADLSKTCPWDMTGEPRQ